MGLGWQEKMGAREADLTTWMRAGSRVKIAQTAYWYAGVGTILDFNHTMVLIARDDGITRPTFHDGKLCWYLSYQEAKKFLSPLESPPEKFHHVVVRRDRGESALSTSTAVNVRYPPSYGKLTYPARTPFPWAALDRAPAALLAAAAQLEADPRPLTRRHAREVAASLRQLESARRVALESGSEELVIRVGDAATSLLGLAATLAATRDLPLEEPHSAGVAERFRAEVAKIQADTGGRTR